MARHPTESRAATAAILLFAAAWSWFCGNRGLFPLDQSIVLDGAWRIADGQVPFRDFLTPHGVTVMALTSVPFRLFGPSYAVYVAVAVVMNVLATAMAMALVGRVLPDRAGLRLLAGGLTAIWFYPVFGTPYSEQTAFLFSLAGLLFVVNGRRLRPDRRNAAWVAAGACAWLAFLSKQNAGGLFLPVYPIVAWALDRPRSAALIRTMLWFGTGFVGAAATFSVWLVAASSPADFWNQYVVVPSGQLSGRWDLFDLLVQPWFGAGRGPTNVVLMLWLFAVGISLASRRTLETGAGICAVALILFQNLFNLTTVNAGENAFGFMGIICALAVASVFPRHAGRDGLARKAALFGAAVLIAVGVVRGLEVGRSRSVHDGMIRADFTESIDRPGWGALNWPQRLDLGRAVVPADDVRQLMDWLERDGRDFFVYPDWTWLYAAFERSSPQPALWFHRGLTYRKGYDERLDRAIVRALRRNDIQVVVLERQSFMGSLDERLSDFPRLREFLDGSFEPVARFGIFEIRVRPDVTTAVR